MNAARCEICKVVIESLSRHDFVQCPGGHIFVDGGSAYFRSGFDKPENFTRIYEDGREENLAVDLRKIEKGIDEYTSTGLQSSSEDSSTLLKEVLTELKKINKNIKELRGSSINSD